MINLGLLQISGCWNWKGSKMVMRPPIRSGVTENYEVTVWVSKDPRLRKDTA